MNGICKQEKVTSIAGNNVIWKKPIENLSRYAIMIDDSIKGNLICPQFKFIFVVHSQKNFVCPITGTRNITQKK